MSLKSVCSAGGEAGKPEVHTYVRVSHHEKKTSPRPELSVIYRESILQFNAIAIARSSLPPCRVLSERSSLFACPYIGRLQCPIFPFRRETATSDFPLPPFVRRKCRKKIKVTCKSRRFDDLLSFPPALAPHQFLVIHSCKGVCHEQRRFE